MNLDNANPEESTTYKVVVNDEEQYSIWPEARANPLGWQDAGCSGSKEECLNYIGEVWTDMRPLSLRKKMEEGGQRNSAAVDSTTATETAPYVDDLLQRLSRPQQAVEVSLRPEKSAEAFHRRIQQGHVYIKFTETRGGTELGVRLDEQGVRTMDADFVNGTGDVHIEGTLRLNYKDVRCVADIDLATLSGQGHLQIVE